MSDIWTDCDVCNAEVKAGNHEAHVREVHPERYAEVYPGSVGDPWMPCSVCHEWHESETAVAAHVAREHPIEFDGEAEDACILCLRDGFDTEWAKEVLEKDQCWRNDDEVNARMVALHATKELPDGVEVNDDTAVEHVWEHHKLVSVETIERERPGNREAKPENPVALAAHVERFARELDEARRTPTGLEVAVAEALQEGIEYTVKEVARETGYTRRHVHQARDDLKAGGLVEVRDDERPMKLVPTGKEPRGMPASKNVDPSELNAKEAAGLHEEHESNYY